MSYEFDGLDALERKLEEMKSLEAVKQCVAKNTKNMGSLAQTTVPVRTGNLKNSMTTQVSDFEGEISFDGCNYAKYVEYGTRKMYGRFYLKKAFDMTKERFKNDMEGLVR